MKKKKNPKNIRLQCFWPKSVENYDAFEKQPVSQKQRLVKKQS